MKLIDLYEQEENEKFFEEVANKCSIFIKQDNVLKRAIKNPPSVQFKKEIRQDRKPLTTAPVFDEILNDLYEQRFGISNLRNKVAYAAVTNHVTDITLYGVPHYIFPSNNCQLFYIPKMMDSLAITNRLKYYILDNVHHDKDKIRKLFTSGQGNNINYNDLVDLVGKNVIEEAKKEAYDEYIFNYKKTKVLPKTSSPSTEVMVYGDFYYAFKKEWTDSIYGSEQGLLKKLRSYL